MAEVRQPASLALYGDTVMTAVGAEQNTVVLAGYSVGSITTSKVAETVKFRVDTGHLPPLTNPEGLTIAIETAAN